MPDLALTIIAGVLGLSWLAVAEIIRVRIQSKPTAQQLRINFFTIGVFVIIAFWFGSLILN